MESEERHLTLAYRLELACAHKDLKESGLAKLLGISPAYLSEVKAQNGTRGHKMLARAAQILEVTPGWLQRGEPPYPEWWPHKIASALKGVEEATGRRPARQIASEHPLLHQMAVQIAHLQSQLSELMGRATAVPIPRLVPCTSCGHGFNILQTVEERAPSSVVVICPHCGSSLTPDEEATSGWRVLKSPHDEARTTPKPH